MNAFVAADATPIPARTQSTVIRVALNDEAVFMRQCFGLTELSNVGARGWKVQSSKEAPNYGLQISKEAWTYSAYAPSGPVKSERLTAHLILFRSKRNCVTPTQRA